MINTPHPHQHAINAWAEGKTIQVQACGGTAWFDCDRDIAPHFSKYQQYRIKPELKPPYCRYAQVTATTVSTLLESPTDCDNVEFIFDGNTHELLDVNRRAHNG